MEPLFYSTGQVARQLGTTQAAVRTLCESGVMASETTRGGHLRIPESEVKRLKRDGLPPMPRPLPTESAPPARNGTADLREHSNSPTDCFEVQSASDQVAITRSMLEKRKIDREIEENEDWFVERQRQKDAAEAVERQKNEAKLAEQRRQQWEQRWIQYALNSVPFDARREVEIEVHAAVDAVLSRLQPSQPATITEGLVDAAVHRALRPWTRKQEIERALDAAINKLPWFVQNCREHASLKQRAWEAAVEALGRLREEASYREMETAAVQAVQPMISEHEHQQDCQRMLGCVYLFDATLEEQEAAKEAVRNALAALPIGAETKELEKALEAAVAPYQTAVSERKEKAQLELEKQAQRRAAERKADLQLDHIARYLEQEYDFDVNSTLLRFSGWFSLWFLHFTRDFRVVLALASQR
jgi:excisionase family DNA binding protein